MVSRWMPVMRSTLRMELPSTRPLIYQESRYHLGCGNDSALLRFVNLRGLESQFHLWGESRLGVRKMPESEIGFAQLGLASILIMERQSTLANYALKAWPI